MPLTLIVGSNGTGKTTIIESLKFVISGEEPPLSDCRRNFINNTEKSKKSSDIALIELQFINSAGEHCFAKRSISASGTGKSITPSVASSFKLGKRPWIAIHRQDEWAKTIPMLFNLPNQAILDRVVLCHQDENLWCMGDSSTVKQIFDRIFGCEQYKNEIKHIDAEIKASNAEVTICERDLIRLKEKVERKRSLRGDIDELASELKLIIAESKDLDEKIHVSSSEKKVYSDEIKRFETKDREKRLLESKADDLRQRNNVLRQSLREPLVDLKEVSNQELEEKIKSHQTLVATSKKRQLESRESIIRLRTEIKRLESKKSGIQVKGLSLVSGNLSKMNTIVNRMKPSADVTTLETLINSTTDIVTELMKQMTINDGIQWDEDDGKSDKIEQLDAAIEAKNEEISEITKNQNFMSDDLSKSFETYEEYMKNVQIRSIMQQIDEVHKKIESLNAHDTDVSDLLAQSMSKLSELETKEMKLREKRSNLIGRKSQIEREITKVRSEHQSLAKANVNYAEALGKLTCNNIVLKDLAKLKECFQKSIIAFHEQMMVKINEVLRSRWKQIYQGKDIETIELVDEETTKGKTKSINYYIALRKNGLRMKMREKSSAGQKALASIILRMTLAELFVKDFAFIALDEPTANLDLPNIISLAKAIGNYVKRRSMKGANIQWIIITHDEQFLRALDAECSPYFYRTKLDDTGSSEIVKLSSRDIDLSELPSQESELDADDNSGPDKVVE